MIFTNLQKKRTKNIKKKCEKDVSEDALRFSRALKLLRVVYWWKVFQKLDKLSVTVAFSLLLTVFCLVGHLLGCVWHEIGIHMYYEEGKDSWLVEHNLIHQSGFERYAASLYWALMTISTIG